MEKIEIHTDSIQLDQLLKWAGIVNSGGQVKGMIEENLIFLNGALVKERRKIITLGDIVEIKENGLWKIVKYQGE